MLIKGLTCSEAGSMVDCEYEVASFGATALSIDELSLSIGTF